MKAASIVNLRKAVEHLDRQTLQTLCLRLARFKLENKELLTYLIFESEDELKYVQGIKIHLESLFEDINTNSYFHIKKSVRKILRRIRKFSRYSNAAETEVELLLFFCWKMKTIRPSIFKNKTEEDLLSRVQKIPIGRMANPKEIALACYRLCSIENTFQTLSNTTISGGE